MSPLRYRMIEDMQVRNLAPDTQRAYVFPVKDNQKNLRENIATAFNEPVFPPRLV